MATRTGPAVLQVHIFRDGEFMGTDVFSERQIVIGRDPDEADLVLESSQVSRKHAIIENDNGKLTVRDAGSPTVCTLMRTRSKARSTLRASTRSVLVSSVSS